MKIDRLIGILTCLLQNEKVTAPKLAKQFEVSRRTIMRDIDTLAQSGIPIATTQGGDGGIFIMEGYKLDKSFLTVDEFENIIAGLKGLESISRTSGIERLIQKLSPNRDAMVSLNEHILINLSSHYKDSLSEKIGIIKKAISDRKLIEFDYYYSKGETKRRIEPYFIQFKWTSWYVFGWCLEREDFRLFKLNRLWGLTFTDIGFNPREITCEAIEKDVLTPEPYNLKLMFDKSIRFRLIEDWGLNCYTETDEGLLLEINYTNRDFIISWVLGFGGKVTVLEPEDFRNEIVQTAKKILALY